MATLVEEPPAGHTKEICIIDRYKFLNECLSIPSDIEEIESQIKLEKRRKILMWKDP